MSNVHAPRRLPPRVYWTRRLVLLALLLAITWALVRCTGGEDPQAGSGAPGETSPTATSPATASSPHHQRSQRTQPVSGVTLVRANLTDARQRCDPATVSVVPQVVAPVRLGEAVPVQLRMGTSAAQPCVLALDASSLLVAVSSGDRQIWSSTRCPGAIPTRSVVLHPHWSAVVDMVWSGRLGRAGCDSTAPAATAGGYTVQAALVEGEPGAADFTLRPAAEPRHGRRNQT